MQQTKIMLEHVKKYDIGKDIDTKSNDASQFSCVSLINTKKSYCIKNQRCAFDKEDNVTMKNTSVNLNMKPTNVKSKVSFSMVEVRIYPFTLGDNPVAHNGLPLTISWDYSKKITMSLNMFECLREPIRKTVRRELKITHERKILLLKNAGFSMVDIEQVKQEMNKIRKSRKRTIRVESYKRIFRDIFSNEFFFHI